MSQQLLPAAQSTANRVMKRGGLVAGLALLVVLVTMFGLRQEGDCSGTVEWETAHACVGKFIEVRGVVASVEDNGQGVWVNLGNAFPSTPRMAIRVEEGSTEEAAHLLNSSVAVEGVPHLQGDGMTAQLDVPSLDQLITE